MSDLSSLLGPTGGEQGSEKAPVNSASPGNLMELKKTIGDKYLSGDYQGAWDDIMGMPDEQKQAAINDQAFKVLIRRVSIKSNNDLPASFTAGNLGVKGVKPAGVPGKGSSGVSMGPHNFGEPLASRPKPDWVKKAEERTGAQYAFDEQARKWAQQGTGASGPTG